MHETSLVRTLLDKVATLLEEHHGETVEDVRIELGPLSGVEPLLVRSAFEMLAPQYSLSDAKLIINEIPLEAKCRDCGALFEIKNFRFRCEMCESSAVQVVRGDEFHLLSITIRQSVDKEASV